LCTAATQGKIIAMSSSANRMPLIDALKAVASQAIVLHHLAAYGPLTAAVQTIAQTPIDWLFDYARIAVQIFLVIGGFLAARGLSPDGQALSRSPLPLIGKRYLRLVVPFLIAIGLAMVSAAIATQWMDDESIPARATLAQWLAHVFLLHGVLGFDSLSAGVWYVAIDFQLFAVLSLLLWLGRDRLPAMLPVLALAIASLFWFNRDAGWDNWAIYFFGSYGLGAAAWWASAPQRMRSWTGLLLTVVVAALVLDFRLRIAVALGTALLLALSRRSGLLYRWPEAKPLDFLGRISYSLFLVHFPVCLLANALYAHLELTSPLVAIAFMVGAWGSSLLAAVFFHRWVESPAAHQRITGVLGTVASKGFELARQLPGATLALLRRVVFGQG
jgi:peptidoglycan/LPS O-acetylase OafA/YrhL